MRSEIRNQKTDELTIAGTAIYPEFRKNSGFTLMELLAVPAVARRAKGSRSAFTLMELLVTISIIAILAAILLPTINSAIERSEVAQAEAEVQSIATAVQAYYNEYSKLPVTSGDHGASDIFKQDSSSKAVFRALLGDNGGSVPNPREIPFLTSSGTSSDGTFLDPWDAQYSIKLDTDYDGRVEYYNTGGDEHSLSVVVVSFGPDGAQGNPYTADDVVSFETD